MPVSFPKIVSTVAAATALLVPTVVFAGSAQNVMSFGEPAEANQATRTVEITMGDNYFEPESLTVAAGETVRFVIVNEGEFLHEFSLGTAHMHAEHQEMMTMMMEHGMLTPTGIDHDMMNMDHSSMGMPDHKHDDPNSILVEPGETQELVWKFAEATGLEFACNVPGHYDSGMMGDVKITPEAQ
jgi:uncharacterized cupredoxin-like copper-binding protein